MGLFRRKSKKDEEEQGAEEDVKQSGQKKILKNKQSLAGYTGKDFKDLGSENKKARREPKKPWGRMERIWVIVVLLLTVGISAYLWLGSLGWQLPRLSKVNFKTPVIFSEETIILEKDR